MKCLLLICISVLRLAAQGPPPPVLQPGAYISKTFIEALIQTRSPFLAVQKVELTDATVFTKEGKSFVTLGWNFHERDISRLIEGDGSLHRVDSGVDAPSFKIQTTSDKSFHIRAPTKFSGELQWVDSLNELLIKHTLEGTYIDSQNLLFRFGANGQATFPDRSFNFKVGVDHIEYRFDNFSGPDVDWAFELQSDRLLLFNISKDEPYTKAKAPFLVLKRMAVRQP